ncbi:MAG TPA: hypothetical protein VMV92_14735 [Streptosporangiaceae bacterium]|nr:hypothetical protein [Streptosporangiaceae bacterium]
MPGLAVTGQTALPGSLFPRPEPGGGRQWRPGHGPPSRVVATAGFAVTPNWVLGVELFTCIWLSACMGVAFLGKVTESRRLGRVLGPLFVYIGGYGPLLCAITTAVYIKELRHAEVRWDKTEKAGKMVVPT